MTVFSIAIRRFLPVSFSSFSLFKWLFLFVVFSLLFVPSRWQSLTQGVLSDAFWQVGVFVMGTLVVYRSVGRLFDSHTVDWRFVHSPYYQIVFSTGLGLLPGCGGAIVVVTQFVKGKVRFSSVVAVLTATMGDAAFLLLAADPKAGGMVLAISGGSALMFAALVEWTHPKDFLACSVSTTASLELPTCCRSRDPSAPLRFHQKLVTTFWQCLLLPCAVIALLMAFQMDVAQILRVSDDTLAALGVIGSMAVLCFWVLDDHASSNVVETQLDWRSLAQQTHTILVYVIASFLLFEFTLSFFGVDEKAWLTSSSEWLAFLPLFGVLIGLLPGCGPQILVTSWYLSGALPFSAQLGNALSNDGDALFPAIALAPKAALVANVYSAIPALLTAYGYFIWFE